MGLFVAPSGTTRALLGLAAAIGGAMLMAWSFVTGIGVALNGGGTGAVGWGFLFFLGLVLVVAALTFGIVGMVRGQSRLLALLTIVVAAIPLVIIVVVWVAAQS